MYPLAFLGVFLSCALSALAGEWADKTLQQMSLEEKIGQLLIIPVCPLRQDERHKEDILRALETYKVGGIIFKQGTLEQEFTSIQEAQAKATYPLLVVADAEWGLAMRASDALPLPRFMTLGAVQDLSLIEQMGSEIGRQLLALGAHMNLAPVLDVNINPQNPVIRMRSFGDDPVQVGERGVRFMKGLHESGILSCAKHFPGHGNTMTDSHVALPTITNSFAELQNVELIPFRMLIDGGVSAVMSAHIIASALDTGPATLSFQWMTKCLQEQMKFNGLLITDALNMEGLAVNFSAKEIIKRAFAAGHDLFLYGDHIAPRIDDILERLIPQAFISLRDAVLEGEILETEIDRRVQKILNAKEKLGLHVKRGPSSFVLESFNSTAVKKLARTLCREAITLVKLVKGDHFPVDNLIVDDQNSGFKERLEKRGVKVITDSSRVLITCGDLRTEAQQKQAEDRFKRWKKEGKEIIAIIFGAPYSIPHISLWADTLVLAYEDIEEMQEAAADLCLGLLQPKGKMPIQTLE